MLIKTNSKNLVSPQYMYNVEIYRNNNYSNPITDSVVFYTSYYSARCYITFTYLDETTETLHPSIYNDNIDVSIFDSALHTFKVYNKDGSVAFSKDNVKSIAVKIDNTSSNFQEQLWEVL